MLSCNLTVTRFNLSFLIDNCFKRCTYTQEFKNAEVLNDNVPYLTLSYLILGVKLQDTPHYISDNIQER